MLIHWTMLWKNFATYDLTQMLNEAHDTGVPNLADLTTLQLNQNWRRIVFSVIDEQMQILLDDIELPLSASQEQFWYDFLRDYYD